jgi:hypothetical protein
MDGSNLIERKKETQTLYCPSQVGRQRIETIQRVEDHLLEPMEILLYNKHVTPENEENIRERERDCKLET